LRKHFSEEEEGRNGSIQIFECSIA